MPTDFQRLIDSLVSQSVEFVIIGGVALVLHGSSRVTQHRRFKDLSDLD